MIVVCPWQLEQVKDSTFHVDPANSYAAIDNSEGYAAIVNSEDYAAIVNSEDYAAKQQ